MESSSSISSSRSSSGSSGSSGSTDEEEEVMEPVRILGTNINLPQDLCEDFNIFKEFFSMETWEDLDEEDKSHLLSFLPNAGGGDEVEEGEETVRMLFEREPFHFTSPLDDFYYNLRQGNYRPDIAKMKKVLTKATTKQQKHKLQSYYAKLLPEVLVTRERILVAANSAPPMPSPIVKPPKPLLKNDYQPPHERAKARYFEELAAIRTEVGGNESDDENYPKIISQAVKKINPITQPMSSEANVLGTLGSMAPSQTAIECLKNVVGTHRLRRQYRDAHPELHTVGITLEAIKQRVALSNGTKKMFGGVKQMTPIQKLRKERQKRESKSGKTSEEPFSKSIFPKKSVEVDPDKKMFMKTTIKIERQESDSENSTYVDPVTISPTPRQPRRTFSDSGIKEEMMDTKYDNLNSMSYMDAKFDSLFDRDSLDYLSGNKSEQAVPIKIEDLDGIDMMTLPVELADDFELDSTMDANDPMLEADDLLAETTYANFLCLVRALFPSKSAHRASRAEIHERCATVLRSPIAPLNTWYTYDLFGLQVSDDWCGELDSALDFLQGIKGPHPTDFVPYLQYIPESQLYQWIGAGRDGDAILGRLCERWLRTSSPSPTLQEVPPPRYPTSWVMRAPSSNEISEFRAQERRRFSAATKPFSYLQHGYRSVVGPCARSSVSCMAFGQLVVTEKPRYATFLTLVRDAAARLPNGEGTIAHIVMMLRMSQYLKPNPDDVWEDAVNTALNKLISKRDPCVKYDYRNALWTYLHRDRTEDDWLKLMNPKTRPAKRSRPSAMTFAPPFSPKELKLSPSPMDMDIGSIEEVIEDGSDIDIDVDNCPSPSPLLHMSSAQLLMQATKAMPDYSPKPASKPHKAKLIPALANPVRPKAKATPRRTSQSKAKQTPKTKTSPSKSSAASKSSSTTKLSTAVSKPSTVVSKSSTVVSKSSTAVSKSSIAVSKPSTAVLKSSTTISKSQTVPKSNEKAQDKKVSKPEVSKPHMPNLQSPPPKLTQTRSEVQQTTIKPIPKLAQIPAVSPAVSHINPAVSHVTPVISHVTSAVSQVSPVMSYLTPSQAHTVIPIISPVSTPNPVITQISPAVSHLPGNVTIIQGASQQIVISKASPAAAAVHRSQLSKQRPLIKTTNVLETVITPHVAKEEIVPSPSLSPSVASANQIQSKSAPQLPRSLLLKPAVGQPITVESPGAPYVHLPSLDHNIQLARSLLLKPTVSQSTVDPSTPVLHLPAPQDQSASAVPGNAAAVAAQRRNVVRVLSPAAAAVTGKSVVPPRLLNQQTTNTHTQLHGSPSSKKRAPATVTSSPTITTTVSSEAQASVPTMVSIVSTVPTSTLATRTVQISTGRTVQLGAHTVHLPPTLQFQLPTHSLRLPSGQTVQITTQQIKPIPTNLAKTPPRPQTPMKTTVQSTQPTVQIPVSTVHYAGQTVQIAGQNVQLTGHTVKLPCGKSAQIAAQPLQLPLQVPSKPTVQLAQSQPTPAQHLPQIHINPQTVQIGGQSVQLTAAQTLQLSRGQTIQLPNGQTLQLSGQALQLNKHQLQLAQNAQNAHLARLPVVAGDKAAAPMVAKLLANAQGQMISLENMTGAGPRTIQLTGLRPQAQAGVQLQRPIQVPSATGQAPQGPKSVPVPGVSGVRVLTAAGNRMSRPVLFTSAKSLHNIILQQNEGSPAVRMNAPATQTSQAIVIGNIGSHATTVSTSTAVAPPVIKLQQGAGSAATTSAGTNPNMRNVLMDGQQLKFIGGRHLLARIIRPHLNLNQQPQQQQQQQPQPQHQPQPPQ